VPFKRKLAAIVTFVVLSGVAGQAGDKPLQSYSTLVVGQFRVDPQLSEASFPAGYEDVLQKGIFARLLTDHVFPQVLDGATSVAGQQYLIAEGVISEFSKGNRAARVAIGYGAGSAKIKVIMTFRDMATGREVLTLEQTGRYAGFGNLTGGSAEKAISESTRKMVEGLLKQIKSAR
jgi:hypothetical protein